MPGTSNTYWASQVVEMQLWSFPEESAKCWRVAMEIRLNWFWRQERALWNKPLCMGECVLSWYLVFQLCSVKIYSRGLILPITLCRTEKNIWNDFSASLVPVFTFGENNLYHHHPITPGSLFDRLQKFFRRMDFPILDISGRWCYLPFRRPLYTVGKY